MKVTLDKFVHGGQALGTLPDGRKVFVWGGLPGETVEVSLTTEKKSYAEGVIMEVYDPSPDRVLPAEPHYLATSPWQIVSEKTEARYKLEILREQFVRAGLTFPQGSNSPISTEGSRMAADGRMYGYRNKIEYVFTETGGELRLAVTERHSHDKIVVKGNMLAKPALNEAAKAVLDMLRLEHIQTGWLQKLTLRSSAAGKVAGVLVVSDTRFSELTLPAGLRGLQIIYTDGFGRRRRSKVLQTLGDITLTDTLLGTELRYGARSFFQVNMPVFEMALGDIRAAVADRDAVELYAGVGSIGLTCGAAQVDLVDIDAENTKFAEENLKRSTAKGRVVTSSSEKALDYISPNKVLVVDPPRAGLSPQVISRILETKPPVVTYLSCDPATLARDLAVLQKMYTISRVQAYDFFPRTPHIETLVVLEIRNHPS